MGYQNNTTTEKYAVSKSYLTSIADSLRSITDSTAAMKPASMSVVAEDIATSVSSQTELLDSNANLIEQIISVLENKSANGGGGESNEYNISVVQNGTSLEYHIFKAPGRPDVALILFSDFNYEIKDCSVSPSSVGDYFASSDIIIGSITYPILSISNINSDIVISVTLKKNNIY